MSKIIIALFFTFIFGSAFANSCIGALHGQVDKEKTLAKSYLNRSENLSRMQNEEFDVVIIGGGSAGLGAAVEATSRGLKVALVEANDYAGETSSRSTKMLHGGVRYLEQLTMAFLKTFKFDKVLYNLLRDALHERDSVVRIAPHLAKPVPIVTPIYKTQDVPYYWAGLRAYDALAGKSESFPRSHYINAQDVKTRFPSIKQANLKGGVVYYDGMFNDARLAIALARTAQENGAALVNYAQVAGLTKNGSQISGVEVVDQLTQNKFIVRGKVVINATGPFTDRIRQMDDPTTKPVISGASGTHIVLAKSFLPAETGMLIPKTEDGRVIFMLPWEGHTLVGTTDNKTEVHENPKATEEDINYILKQIGEYYDVKPTRSDVLASWTGIRPLVSDPRNQDTAKLARDHVVIVSPSHLVTITGGKWTTYRKMAEHVVEQAVQTGGLKTEKPLGGTDQLILVGGREYSPELASQLQKEFKIDSDKAEHLAHNYGDNAKAVLHIAVTEKKSARLSPSHPFLEAEVIFAIRAEGAQTAVDIISRRMRFAFLDKQAAKQALPKVIELAGNELNWSEVRKKSESEKAIQDLSF